jgi:predicted small secreted protein
MKKNVLVMLSLLVIAMFLVGCVETVEETGEEVADDEALAGQASRFKKASTPKFTQIEEPKATCGYVEIKESDWEDLESKYRISSKQLCNYKGYQEPAVLFKQMTLSDDLVVMPGVAGTLDFFEKSTISNYFPVGLLCCN